MEKGIALSLRFVGVPNWLEELATEDMLDDVFSFFVGGGPPAFTLAPNISPNVRCLFPIVAEAATVDLAVAPTAVCGVTTVVALLLAPAVGLGVGACTVVGVCWSKSSRKTTSFSSDAI